MNRHEYEALIQEVLDGTATPQEAERLRVWLETDELGRTRRLELQGVFEALGRIPPADPPAGLREAVLRTIQTRERSVLGHRVEPRGWFGPKARLAFVFAAGLLAGVVGLGAMTGVIPPVSPGSAPTVSGSLMPPPAAGALRRGWNAGGAQIEAITWRAGTTRLVAVRLRGREPAEVELTFDPQELSPGAIRQSGPSAAVEMEAGRVKVRGEDRGEYTIEFPDAGSDATIQVAVRSGRASAAGELPAP